MDGPSACVWKACQVGCWRRLRHFNDFGSFVCILIVHSCEIVQCNAIMNLQRLSSSSSSYKRTPQPYLSVLFTPTSNTTFFLSNKISLNFKFLIFQYPQTFAHFPLLGLPGGTLHSHSSLNPIHAWGNFRSHCPTGPSGISAPAAFVTNSCNDSQLRMETWIVLSVAMPMAVISKHFKIAGKMKVEQRGSFDGVTL